MLSKFWSDLTSADISKLGKNKILILPFSSVEQHGEHLPSGTDKLILDGILNTFIKNPDQFTKLELNDIPKVTENQVQTLSKGISASTTLETLTLNYVNLFDTNNLRIFVNGLIENLSLIHI